MNRRKLPLIDGDEYDMLTRWRHITHHRAGEPKTAKRKYAKRVRQTERDDIEDQLEQSS